MIRLGFMVAGAVVLASNSATAQISPNGDEFQVNTYTTSEQNGAAVASAADGTVLITWNSLGSSGTDQDGYSIQGQRIGPDGSLLGSEFQVNTYTTSSQTGPSVAIDSAGGSTIAWWGWNNPYEPTLRVQRFDPTGAAAGDEFQVNTTPLSYTWYWSEPDITHDPARNFVIAWTINADDVRARRFDPDGNPLSDEFVVNSATAANEYRPSISSDGAGNFIVAWDSYWIPGQIQARRFDARALPRGVQFPVETSEKGHQRDPSVAADAVGNFVVVWSTWGPIPSYWGPIRAQRFDAEGVPVGKEFEVSTTWSGSYPEVASDRSGNFVVVWSSEGSDGTDTSGRSVQARQFGRDGSPLGPPSQVNTYTTGNQSKPDVALDGAGNFVVVWTSDGSYGTDSDGQSVQARRYDALFRDGVESGDLARWSTTAP